MIPTIISFEEQYSDNSGVEYAIRYDASTPNATISIQHIDSITLDYHKIDWLIERLHYIKDKIDQ